MSPRMTVTNAHSAPRWLNTEAYGHCNVTPSVCFSSVMWTSFSALAGFAALIPLQPVGAVIICRRLLLCARLFCDVKNGLSGKAPRACLHWLNRIQRTLQASAFYFLDPHLKLRLPDGLPCTRNFHVSSMAVFTNAYAFPIGVV